MTIPRRQSGAAAAALLVMLLANGSQAAETAINPAYRAQPRPIHYETPLSPRDGPQGGGKVRLSWTAPSGEPVRYQVKWARRPMLERIDWQTQAHTHTNWWAAANVPNEPHPSAAGARQSMIIEGLDAGPCYFGIRSYDAARNRSDLSNPAVTTVP